MSNPLDFSMIANNDEAVLCTVRRKDKTLVSLTGFIITWGMFLNGVEKVSKASTDATQISIPDQTVADNVGKFYLYIDAANTKDLETEILYTHEFNFVDTFSKSTNPSKDDLLETAGEVYLRRQYKKQT